MYLSSPRKRRRRDSLFSAPERASMEARRVQILLCAASVSSLLAIALFCFFFFFLSPVSPLLPSLKPVLVHLLYRLRDIFAFLAFTAAIALAIFTTQKKPGKEEAALAKASLGSVTAFHHLASIFGDFQEEEEEEEEAEEEREEEDGSDFLSGGKQRSSRPRNGLYLAAQTRQITRRSCDDSGSITTCSSKLSQRKVSLLHRKTSSFDDECLNSNSPSNVAACLESRQTCIDTKVSFAASESLTANSSVTNDVKSEEEKIECHADASSSPFEDDSFSIHSRTRMSVFDANDVDDGMVGSGVDSSPALHRTRQTFSIRSEEDRMEYDESLLTSPNEINRQADAFIARVNEQMRLQMLASIERQRKKDHSN